MEKSRNIKRNYSSFLRNKKGQKQFAFAAVKEKLAVKSAAFKRKREEIRTKKIADREEKKMATQQKTDMGTKKRMIGVAGAGALGGVLLNSLIGGSYKDKSRMGRIFLFLFAVSIHVIDALTGFSGMGQANRFFMYFLLAMFAWFVYKESTWDLQKLFLFFFTSFFIYMLPVIRALLINWNSSKAMITGFDFIFTFSSLWVIYILFTSEDIPFLRFWTIIYLILWFAFFFSWYVTNVNNTILNNLPVSAIDPYKSIKDAGKMLKSIWINNILTIGETAKEIPEKIKKAGQEGLDYATGGYYKGEEEQVKEPFGVFLKNTEAIQTKYYPGEPVTVLADLEAENIGKTPVEVSVICYAEDTYEEGQRIDADLLYPPTPFKIEGNEKTQIDCIFLNNHQENEKDKKNMQEGIDYTIHLNVTFSFETDARILTYWMDYDRYKTLDRQSEDSLQKLEIPELEPPSIFTNGPVQIGMGVGKPPIQVGGGAEAVVPRLGLTLDSNWDRGEIVNIKELELDVPDVLSLNLESCTAKIEESDKIMKGFKVYHLVEPINVREKYRTITCRFNEIPSSILGQTPVTLRYVKAKAKYTYLIEDSVEVEILENSEETSEITTEEATQIVELCGNKIIDKGEICDESSSEDCFVFGQLGTKKAGTCQNCKCIT
jgi:hypothetical protein